MAPSITKALELFVEPEQLDGENAYKCSKYVFFLFVCFLSKHQDHVFEPLITLFLPLNICCFSGAKKWWQPQRDLPSTATLMSSPSHLSVLQISPEAKLQRSDLPYLNYSIQFIFLAELFFLLLFFAHRMWSIQSIWIYVPSCLSPRESPRFTLCTLCWSTLGSAVMLDITSAILRYWCSCTSLFCFIRPFLLLQHSVGSSLQQIRLNL